MAIGNQGRVLRIYQGQELQFHVSRDICCEYSLLNPAYQQAGHALIEILNHTKAFHEHIKPFHEPSNDANNTERELFEYGGNIILFAAPRGGGKTRMMLSFSHVLENPRQFNDPSCLGKAVNKDVCHGCKDPLSFALKDPNKEMHSWLKESSFIITEPIAPAALEKEQSILYVVLSRLYRYVEKLLGKHYINCRITESQKNELQICFHRCLSGINGLKKPTDSMPEDFSVLQDISDGLSLRYHFHQLISKILKIAAPTNKTDHRYLVLQIDDADSKIDGVYEVFEDIRKYLLVPNLVILLSADLDFLHRTITEEQLKRFHSLHQFEKDYAHEYSGELSRIARKYIDKLIPPSHQINLPELGRMKYPDIKELRLDYVKEDVGKESNTEREEHFASLTLETTILRLIYRKTGVLFVSPTAYLHNIIPRTQRGINQLLFILNGMDDIPPIRCFNPKTEANPNENFIDNVLAQVEIAQRNLARFSEYFIYDWIKVKIKSSQDRDFLHQFSSVTNGELTYITCKHLKRKYPNSVVIPDSFHAFMNRSTLDYVLQSVERVHRTPEDFLFFFAIRTLLTLNSHQSILYQKKKTLEDKKKTLQNHSEDQLVVFNFDSQNTFIAETLPVKDIPPHLDQNIKDICSTLSNLSCYGNPKLSRVIAPYSFDPHPLVPNSYMNFYLVLLQLKSIFDDISVSFKIQEAPDGNQDNQCAAQQEIVYRLQEYALSIVANSDVYCKLYRKTKDICEYIQIMFDKREKPSQEGSTFSGLSNTITKLQYFFRAIEKQLTSLNNNTLPEIWSMTSLDSFSALSKLTTTRSIYSDEEKRQIDVEGTILNEIKSSIDKDKNEDIKAGKTTPEGFADAIASAYADKPTENNERAAFEESDESGKAVTNDDEHTEKEDKAASEVNREQQEPGSDDVNTNQ